MSKQLRNFVFTWNNPYGEGKGTLEEAQGKMTHLCTSMPIKYMIYGVEIGEKKTPHFQGYVELSKRVAFDLVKRSFGNSHIEPRRGSQQQAIEYCRKEGNYHEWGEPKAQGDRTDLQRIKLLLEHTSSIKQLLESDEDINSHGLRLAERLIKYTDKPRDYAPEVIWFFGKTGVGKTRLAVQLLPDAYFKSNGAGKWWANYDGEEDVIIDDVRAANYPFHEMLGLLDRYAYTVEDKGTIRQFKGRRIVITAPDDPSEIYKHTDGEDIKQLLRRITLVQELESEVTS